MKTVRLVIAVDFPMHDGETLERLHGQGELLTRIGENNWRANNSEVLGIASKRSEMYDSTHFAQTIQVLPDFMPDCHPGDAGWKE